ncbi:MAG: LacI family DNA-binding transcriptional regulator [Bacteroidetes bacterium]|nr:LacI family DNA-binding transcriptional regulator [Bacteroidota bacterium]
MSVTIYDIAREANVGIGTVSRVLNNSANVTTETRERVITVARKLNYQPHAFAQALARKRSNTLSAIIPFFTNYFFIEVLQGVQETLSTLGYDLIIHGANNQQQVGEYLQRSMRKGRVDGTLLFSLELPENFVAEFAQKKVPLVLVDTFHPQFDSIRVDNAGGATIATEHLLSLGHRNIGMINANLQSAPARERLASFRQTLQQAGVTIPEGNIVNSDEQKNDGFSRESGFRGMMEFLGRGLPVPTAFFVSSDIQAIGVLAALRERNIRVPEDVAIVSFDDVELAKNFDLTTMRQPMFKMGELAVKKMIERIEHPDAPVSSVSFKPGLVIRASCGANKQYVFHEQ